MAVTLATLKGYLRITHAYDDVTLTMILEGATDQARQFCDVSELPDEPACNLAVCMLARAGYDAPADEQEAWRNAAERVLWPYRNGLGV